MTLGVQSGRRGTQTRSRRSVWTVTPTRQKLLVTAAICLVTLPIQVSGQLPESTRSDAFILLREGLVTPEALGAPGLDGLGIAEPLSNLVLVDPPVANNQGNAALAYPLEVPRGRAGVQPELTLVYDSGGGNGQTGLGWSLATSAISIDTRWGVPRYLAEEESETYTLDGDVLAPTAVRATRLPREPDRVFTRRVEGSFERIRRWGSGPGEYWWEVTDTIGTARYYGGTPEGGRDPSAILATDDGKGFSWALTQIRDLSGNVADFRYQIVAGSGVGNLGDTIGRDIYLDRIVYTGTILPCPADIPDCDVAPYEVDIVRASEVPQSYQRADVPVDALGGFLRVTSDLVYRIDVYYLGELARRYVLNYEEGVFGKTRLASIGQAGRDGVVWAEHAFEYYDDVLDANGNYVGFAATPETWDTGQDGVGAPGIDLGGEFHGSASALGGVAGLTLLAVEGYVGFNPVAPTKTGSFGAGFQGSRSSSNSVLEMLDMNGDALPDKVFRSSGDVQQRLNRSGPGGITTFSGAQAVANLADLSQAIDWTAQGGGEVYLVATAIAHRGNTFSEGRSYFIDVNGDLRPDRVSNGQVFFNYADGGATNFSPDSSLTEVPLAAGSVSEAVLPDLSELEAEQRENSPLIDTLRRWRAPWPGTVSVQGEVSLMPPAPDGVPGDGVRVAIQKDGTELWAATIDAGDFDPRTPVGVSSIAVNKGEDLYFRVQSRDDGASDQVLWNPEIRYTGVADMHDANGLPVYHYRASDDFTLGGRTGSVANASLDGTVRVEGDLHKSGKTTDDVIMKVYRSGVEVASQVVGRDETGDFPFAAEFAVTNPDGGQHEILVRLQIDSPVDLGQLSWAPLIYYVEATSQGEPVMVTDSEGNPTHVINAAVDYQMYPANNLGGPQQPWTSPWSRTVIGDPEIGFAGGAAPTGSVVLTVKKVITPASPGDPPSERVAKKRLNFVDGVLQNDDPTLTFGVSEDARYWFDFSVADPEFAMDWNAATLRLRFEAGGDTEATPPAARHWAYIPATVFPMAYRGWGIAGYDGNGTRASQPVAEGRLVFDEDDYSDEPENPDPPKPKAFVYAPFVGEASSGAAVIEWRGPKSNLFGSAIALGSSRLGSDSIGLPNPGQGTGTFGVSRVSESPQWSVVGGLGGLLGVTAAWGPGIGLLDYLDMNGDQFPDIVGPTAIQYTTPRGALEPDVVDVCSGVVRRDSSMTVSGGLDISLASVQIDPKGQSNTAQKSKSKSGQKGKSGTGKGNGGKKGDANNSSELTLGLNGSLGRSLTNFPESEFPGDIDFSGAMGRIANRYSDCGPLPSLEQDLADINGDGLPDRIKVDDQGRIRVNFNLGYGFDATDVPWASSAYPGFETGFTDSFSVGVPLGFSVGPKAYGGGLAASASRTHQKVTWVDLNGDGLIDQLVNSFGMGGVLDVHLEATDVLVAFGTGSGLTPHRAWPNFPLHENTPISQNLLPDIAKSLTVGVGIGGYFTYGVGPLCVAACYIILGVGGGADTSMTRQTTELVDVDGDGYLDHVSSDRDSSMSVARNRTGKTNLLREVRNPIGGAIRLRYERAGNTPEQPFSQWVMSEVELDDGRPGDGPDLQLTRYAYSDNRFDHLERETLGFAQVVEEQLDTANGQQVMRRIVRDYLNDSVFTRGLMVSERLEGPDWGPFMDIRNSWSFVNVATGAEADLERPGVELLELAVFPRVSRIDQLWFENHAVSRSTFWEFEHDRRGNVIEVLDIGEPGDADDMIVTLTYGCQEGARTAEETWVNLPLTLEIRLAVGGDLLRKRRAEQLCANNSPTALWEDHGAGESFTQLEYDFWGNYGHIVYPANHKGERYEVTYTFDSPRFTDIARVEDSFGLVATATWQGSNGQLASRTDPNGQETRYTYDAQGRLVTITAPYEQGTGHPTIAFEYFPGAEYAYALAHHHDASRPGDPIDTAAFVDGLGRLTQSKQDATVFRGAGQAAEDVTVVSGALEFDALGRVVREWYPAEEPKGAMATFNPVRDGVEPTRTAWTFFDELGRVVAPNGAVNAFEYTFDRAIPEAGNMLVATGTDPNGNVSRTFTNMAGYIEFEEQDLLIDGEPTTLQYVVLWDSLDQFIGVIDPEGNATVHELDLQGRRVATETPDGGRVEFVYDDGARLVEKITPNLRAAGQSIRYEHDFDRLVAVDYPDATPDVFYTYGPADAPGNAAGRLVRVEDGSRIQELQFGRMGEVIEETDTMRVHNSTGKDPDMVTWRMAFEFDSWGRLHELVYPDGEVVSYTFDAGGLVAAVSGLDAGNAYPYVTAQAYDKFAMRRYQEAGNGVRTLTTYYPDSRWLEGHRTDGPDRDVQDIRYTYDLAGNVLSITNDAPRPVPSLMGGTSAHRYSYDELHRLVSGLGTYEFDSGKTREYSYDVAYDVLGNVTWKRQTDAIHQGKGKGSGKSKGKGANTPVPQFATSYEHHYRYGPAPHQAEQIGDKYYDYDANGNLLGWEAADNGTRRALDWDAEDRLVRVADQGSSTEYRYDDAGQLSVERGPHGETLFVNKYYAVRNGTVAWKNIWADDDQVATKRQKDRDLYEDQQFLLHKDLRGNVRIVTDPNGKIYEYLEYFPGGEGWVVEHSNTERVPYRFLSGYYDEDRALYNLGARWYEPREQVFHSSDPVLVERPQSAVANPALLAAYTFGDNNPLRFTDRDGRAPVDALLDHLEKRYLGADAAFSREDRARFKAQVAGTTAFPEVFTEAPGVRGAVQRFGDEMLRGLKRQIAKPGRAKFWKRASYEVPPVIKVKVGRDPETGDKYVKSVRVFKKKFTFKPKKAK